MIWSVYYKRKLNIDKRKRFIKGEMKADIELALKVTFLISIPLTFIYVILSKPLANLLYNDIEVADFIHIMGYATVLLALGHTLSGILYGINKQVNATIFSL